ncbi:hypothetical protein GCM10010413_37200 [Promicromonospora sukumoe]|uniref:Uncharacterized protein n=1 Tax=Promicromonospora sukumoe TaxID=88382 RepID=A0A7W3PD72_9MICO|nr:hypothetical protein [Promicromonospora sukumoe]
MGTLEPRPLVAGSGPRPDVGPHQPVAGRRPVPDGGAHPQANAGNVRRAAGDVLEPILAVLGPERIARAAVAWAIQLEPRFLYGRFGTRLVFESLRRRASPVCGGDGVLGIGWAE